MRMALFIAGLLMLGTLGSCGLTEDDPCGKDAPDQVFLLDTNAKVEAALGCEVLSNNVVIDGFDGGIDLTDFAFSNLTTIEESLLVRHVDSVETITFPQLTQASSDGRFSNGAITFDQNDSLRSISMPALEFMGFDEINIKGQIGVFQNAALESIDLSSLRIAETVRVQSSPLLEELVLPAVEELIGAGPEQTILLDQTGAVRLSAPNLTGIGGLVVTDNPSLETVSFPMATGGDMNIQNNTALTTVQLPELTSGSIGLEGNLLSTVAFPALTESTQVSIRNNSGLTQFSAPLLTQIDPSYLYVEDNDDLVELDLAMLDDVAGQLLIRNNPMLPDCEAIDVYTQTGKNPVDATGNLGDGCE